MLVPTHGRIHTVLHVSLVSPIYIYIYIYIYMAFKAIDPGSIPGGDQFFNLCIFSDEDQIEEQ